jgi:hypothetical protein
MIENARRGRTRASGTPHWRAGTDLVHACAAAEHDRVPTGRVRSRPLFVEDIRGFPEQTLGNPCVILKRMQ